MKSLVLAVIIAAGFASACGPSNLASTPPVDSRPAQPTLHVVVQGDNYEAIAARYHIEVSALLAANALTPTTPLNPGQPLVLPAAPASTVTETPSPTTPATPPPPRPFSKEWRDAQIQRVKALIEDIRAREGGVFFLGGAAVVGGFLALQVVIWLARELVLTLVPVARKLGAISHDLWLNIWYAAWWVGLGIWVPASAIWRTLRPFVEPRARALSSFALERGTTWSRRGARWAQAQGKRAALAIRDEAIEALEELALHRPALRGVSEKVQELAYKEARAVRSHLPARTPEAWPPSEQELLAALSDGSLTVQFSPMFDMAGVTVAAFESSLTWDRGGPDPISAARLGAVVERPGYTRIQRALLEHTLRQACARLESDAGDEPAPSIAVPLGRTQFFDPTLFSVLRRVLQESGAPSSQLELGVDERVVLSDLPAASEVLNRLRELGIATNLRGFGALTTDQLQELPVAAVTVDFWNSRHDARAEDYVAESVRSAHAAGLAVTAWRAETPEELEFARALGCERLASTSAEHAPPLVPQAQQDQPNEVDEELHAPTSAVA